MPNILSLVMNENMKVYRRFGTWVMIGLLVAVIIVMGFVIKFESGGDAYFMENWQQELTQQNETYREILAEIENEHMQDTSYFEELIAINEYRLSNDLPPVSGQTLRSFMELASNLTILITVFTVIIASGMIASEFSTGTIKLLLIRPVSRAKILLSKYLSTLIFPILLLVILFVISYVLGGLLFGFGDGGQVNLVYTNGVVEETTVAQQIFSIYGFNSIELVMIVTFAFMISSAFRSSSLAIGCALILLFVGANITMFLANQYDWVKYILFANTNLTQYVYGTPLIEGMTLSFSIVMLILYFVLFNLISWVIFTRRDVAS